MIDITHLNFGWLQAPGLPPACCHGLVVRSAGGVVLVDPGIGMQDVFRPVERVGLEAIESAGFQFLPQVTAVRQLEALGITAADVTDIVLTHADPDHAGGLADFPHARIHLSIEERENLESGNPRYREAQFAHGPQWVTYAENDCETLGMQSRRVATAGEADIRLVPLFGHTLGHCGVAVQDGDAWVLHVGDAYYLRGELANEAHPIGALATMRADDNDQRLASLALLRRVTKEQENALTYFGYHDVSELPEGISMIDEVR
ncbi:MBL fold metallo-hydrolase [Aeoliella sp. SH292]|uniref:MBL fold metallo-hydrolase n=1 Tax=Aeoliella sp. SH292 TaxID=3454464 RepID=UPI003F99581F